ncbi:hypothetical protein RHGRI_012746 [Rhododendron griersonianum]|uniref:Translation initiation factor 1 n=1 Tax=Rhododendron griersonianum TaxID=479676 RepID=A0AAV6KRM7_9ERIC|nr:hypothetical protein RHGRI_012746 [Rhododendron griersonianum]
MANSSLQFQQTQTQKRRQNIAITDIALQEIGPGWLVLDKMLEVVGIWRSGRTSSVVRSHAQVIKIQD